MRSSERTLKNSAEQERSVERDINDCEWERSGELVKSAAQRPLRSSRHDKIPTPNVGAIALEVKIDLEF